MSKNYSYSISMLLLVGGLAQGQNSGSHNANWTRNPFDRKVFIENKGQFGTAINTNEKVLYQVYLGDVKANFTKNGVVYRYDEYENKGRLPGQPAKKESEVKNQGREREREEENEKRGIPQIHYLSAIWKGADAHVGIEAEEQQSYPYTFPVGPSSSIKVHVYKKIVYHGIYPGIDIEYVFPEGNKTGIEFSVIVHPGADIDQVKLEYENIQGIAIDANGNVIIKSEVGVMTEHIPTSCYTDKSNPVRTAYVLNGSEISFSMVGLRDKSKTLVIDPWTSNTIFTSGVNKACDVDYDNYGNVYAYGGWGPFQLTKFNSSGTIQWIYSNTTFATTGWYGDFAVDKVTGTSYLVEANGHGNTSGGSRVEKIDSSSNLKATYPGNATMNEMWRAKYNSCTGKIVIGGGGTNVPANYTACMLDTDMVSMTPVNSLNAADNCHDICLLTMNLTGDTAFMATTNNYSNSNFNNIVMAIPVPALTPPVYIVADGYAFTERFSVDFIPGGQSIGPQLSMDGMAASPNWLYMWDGSTLKKVSKGTGTVVAHNNINTPVYNGHYGGNGIFWGGLDADACDNVYVGDISSIQIYNSALSLVSTIPLSDTVYDVVLGQNYNTIYAVGNGYVSSISNPNPPSVSIKNVINPGNCSCSATATPSLLLCGTAPATSLSYTWSTNPVQTTQTATGLCIGNYTVTISLGCGSVFLDTFRVNCISPPTVTISGSTLCPGSCFKISPTPSGGLSPYTYNWSPGGDTTADINVCPLVTTTYTVTLTDHQGTTATYSAVVTVNPAISIGVSNTEALCNGLATGTATASPSGGAVPYTFRWSNGETSAKDTSLNAGTYTVSVTDSKGCSSTSVLSISEPAPVTLDSVTTVGASCGLNNGSAVMAASGGTGAYSYSWSNGAKGLTNSGLSAGAYTVTVSDANNCTATGTVAVGAFPAPIADFTPSPSGGFVPLKIDFTNSSSNATRWIWNYGDGQKDTLKNPTHTFTKDSTYDVCLIVESLQGCLDSMCKEIVVSALVIAIPNVFSPNGDGVNDVFKLTTKGVLHIDITIWDRWGLKVWEGSGAAPSWDGTTNGNKLCPDGTYYYIIKVDDFENTAHNYDGFVMLVR